VKVCLGPNIFCGDVNSLHLLQRGDYYFFSRSYSRDTRQLSPVQPSPMSKAVKEDVHTLAALQLADAGGAISDEQNGTVSAAQASSTSMG
jgi:hypothetical protein